MASFREKNGSWEYIVSAGFNPVTKKYEKITKSGFRTKTEAKHAARRVEEELKEGTYVKESKKTFGEFTEDWIAHYEKRAKVSSVRARKIAAKRLLDEWEHYPISNVTMSMYQQHIDELSTKFSRNYIDSIHSTGRMIFKHAEKLKVIKHNPTNHFEMPRMVKDEVTEKVVEVENFLERDELMEFLLLVKNEGLRNDLVVFTTLAYSGLRVGELLALKESDIDFKTNEIRVTKTYYNPRNNKREFSLLAPKTAGSVRTVELDPFVIGLIREQIKQLKEEKMKYRKVYNDQGFLFVDQEGFPMPIKMVALRLQRLMKIMNRDIEEHKRKHITPHSFRHTNISLLIEAQVPISEIQRRVGHTDINTTMNIYTHMTKQTKDQAANLFSSHLSDLTAKLR
ncbi:site-specific integrase [Sporosarcina obsidiansis]|uniref:site-specific integrase n=1 Tax=Sporosarcina obsidiansis TaxID=2660748 RepID=UPI00129B5652|nr:site-specific integrase [Sporosarcina obsidiansis]